MVFKILCLLLFTAQVCCFLLLCNCGFSRRGLWLSRCRWCLRLDKLRVIFRVGVRAKVRLSRLALPHYLWIRFVYQRLLFFFSFGLLFWRLKTTMICNYLEVIGSMLFINSAQVWGRIYSLARLPFWNNWVHDGEGHLLRFIFKLNQFKLWTVELTRRNHSSEGRLWHLLSLIVRIWLKRIAVHLVVTGNSLDYMVLDWQYLLNWVMILNIVSGFVASLWLWLWRYLRLSYILVTHV